MWYIYIEYTFDKFLIDLLCLLQRTRARRYVNKHNPIVKIHLLKLSLLGNLFTHSVASFILHTPRTAQRRPTYMYRTSCLQHYRTGRRTKSNDLTHSRKVGQITVRDIKTITDYRLHIKYLLHIVSFFLSPLLCIGSFISFFSFWLL